MKQKLLLVLMPIIALTSCAKQETNLLNSIQDSELQGLHINHFDTKEALNRTIDICDGEVISTKTSGIDNIRQTFFLDANSIDINSDPILSVEAEALNLNLTDLSGDIYHLFGYDWRVPNKTFASLLNYRGEIAVSDTVYKVSPRGTYYFSLDILRSFEQHYNEIFNSEIIPLGDALYTITIPEFKNVIFLQDTYGTNGNIYTEDMTETIEIVSETNSIATKGNENDDWKDALKIDWDSQDKYYTDAKTWAGEVIQGVIGRNASFEKMFDSKHRLKSKLYYYDYAVYSEIGALSKMQKKNWIGWSLTKPEELYQIWSNMIIWTPFAKTVSYPHIGSNNDIPREYIGSNIEEIPGIGKTGRVVYFAGRGLTDAELKRFANSDYVQGVIDLKINVDFDELETRPMAAKYITEKGIYLVIYPYGKMTTTSEEIQSKFSKDFHISFGISLTPGALPTTFKGWLDSVSAEKLKAPKLLQGEMRTAAKFKGETKGMRLIKQNEDE